MVYQKKERQNDLVELKSFLKNQFFDKQIIEIACGTGYFTKIIADKSKNILATDINLEVLELAKNKIYPNKNVAFKKLAIENLNTLNKKFEGLFGGFIWSHIKKQNLKTFLQNCFSVLKNEAELIFIDNKFVKGSSTKINRKDDNQNTYQLRTLKSGEVYEVVKNFATKNEIENWTKNYSTDFKWIELEYYWIAKFKKQII